jgi:hypothetical protein
VTTEVRRWVGLEPGCWLRRNAGCVAGPTAARSLCFAPRPRARRRAIAASRLLSAIDFSKSFPVYAVSFSTSDFASAERRRIVRVTARSVRPIARERSRTRRFCSLTSFASCLASRASYPHA